MEMSLVDKLFRKKEENVAEGINIKYEIKVGSDFEPVDFFDPEFEEKMDYNREKRIEVLENERTKELTIIKCCNLANDAKTGDYSPEERYDMLVESLTTLRENDVEISYIVKPSELFEALDYLKHVADENPDSPDIIGLTQEIETARKIMSDKGNFEKYLCDTSPDIIARIYVNRLVSN